MPYSYIYDTCAELHSLLVPVAGVTDLPFSSPAVDVWFLAIISGVSEGGWHLFYTCKKVLLHHEW